MSEARETYRRAERISKWRLGRQRSGCRLLVLVLSMEVVAPPDVLSVRHRARRGAQTTCFHFPRQIHRQVTMAAFMKGSGQVRIVPPEPLRRGVDDGYNHVAAMSSRGAKRHDRPTWTRLRSLLLALSRHLPLRCLVGQLAQHAILIDGTAAAELGLLDPIICACVRLRSSASPFPPSSHLDRNIQE